MAKYLVRGVDFNVLTIESTHPEPLGDVVLLHGLASNMGFWFKYYAEELRKYFRVSMFDMRGHGRTGHSKNGYRPVDLAGDLRALLRVMNIDKPHIMAHSFGGTAALQLHKSYPGFARSFVIIDSQISLGRIEMARNGWAQGDFLVDFVKNIGINLDKADPNFGIHLLTAIARTRLESDISLTTDPRIRNLLDIMPTHVSRHWLKLADKTNAIEEFCTPDTMSFVDLNKIGVPLLALYGDKSPSVYTAKILDAAVEKCDLKLLRDCGHFFAINNPILVLKHCLDFWDMDVVEEITPTHAEVV